MGGLDPRDTFAGDRFDGRACVTDDGPTYNPNTDTYVGTFEVASASLAVTEALATIRHCEPTELEPLYHSVDPDALDRLVKSGTDQLRVTMQLDGFEVVVTGDRRVEITPPE
ncbi:HalOD1 output domain-containing protein [Haloarcula laminariae]|uniref:HalOD1 output domain-containing protein n=1 Tax=Haloarcula laminariae TaxID=2961577 RepID=UPI0021C9A808|nr:HalOD1 output domain-containing protein [Halomicroarcula laminariae]